jgi:RNA polymerase sigma factor (sigma-70 family)
MATSQASEVIRHLHRAVLRQGEAGLTDGQLLESFLSRRDEAAMEVLVRRHGPMVWGVCRRILRSHHDAEDAFQATFLVLAHRAASVASRELLANWLYGVARQTALKARATVARRRGRERQVTDMPEPALTAQDVWDDLRPLLDAELSRLPDKYRVVIVLCDLEGKTRTEAAGQLGLPEGTVASRLARARAMLAKRLARHGLALPAALLAGVLSREAASACVPPPVVPATVRAASLPAAGRAGTTPTEVAALTEGVLRAMSLSKLRAVAAVVLLVCFTGLGAAVAARRVSGAGQANEQQATPPEPDRRAERAGPAGEASKEKPPEEDPRLLIDRVLNACGGEGRLRRLNAFTEKVKDMEAFGGTSTSEYFVQLPDKLRIVTERQADGKKETVIVVWNGQQQWRTKDGVEVEPEHPLDYWKDFVRFFGPRAVLRLKAPECRVRLLPSGVQVHRTPVTGLGVHKGPMSRDLSLFLYFDEKTGLLLKQEDNLDDTEIVYEDYKTFDGLPVARKVTYSVKTRGVTSQVTGKSEVIEFKVRDELDARLFQRP